MREVWLLSQTDRMYFLEHNLEEIANGQGKRYKIL